MLTDWGTYLGLVPFHLDSDSDSCSGLGPLLDSDYGSLSPHYKVGNVRMTSLYYAVNMIILDCTFYPQGRQILNTPFV